MTLARVNVKPAGLQPAFIAGGAQRSILDTGIIGIKYVQRTGPTEYERIQPVYYRVVLIHEPV